MFLIYSAEMSFGGVGCVIKLKTMGDCKCIKHNAIYPFRWTRIKLIFLKLQYHYVQEPWHILDFLNSFDTTLFWVHTLEGVWLHVAMSPNEYAWYIIVVVRNYISFQMFCTWSIKVQAIIKLLTQSLQKVEHHRHVIREYSSFGTFICRAWQMQLNILGTS